VEVGEIKSAGTESALSTVEEAVELMERLSAAGVAPDLLAINNGSKHGNYLEGEKISIVCFPGLALNQLSQEESTAGVHKAFEQGINHFDVAPAYGTAEVKMGPALQGIDRRKIFLSCKTKMRDKEGARQELERSLEQIGRASCRERV